MGHNSPATINNNMQYFTIHILKHFLKKLRQFRVAPVHAKHVTVCNLNTIYMYNAYTYDLGILYIYI